jgi:hypothetical protein
MIIKDIGMLFELIDQICMRYRYIIREVESVVLFYKA